MTAFPSSILTTISAVDNRAQVSGFLKKSGIYLDIAKIAFPTTVAVDNYAPLTRLPATAKLIEIWRRGPAAGGATTLDIGVYNAIDWVNSTTAQQDAAVNGSRQSIGHAIDMNVNAVGTGRQMMMGGASSLLGTIHAVYGSRLDAPLWVHGSVAQEPRPGTQYDVVGKFFTASFPAASTQVFFIHYSLGI